MQIRTATIQDLEAIASVEAECFPPAEAATREEFAERLRDSLEIGCFIHIDAGEYGYAIIRRRVRLKNCVLCLKLGLFFYDIAIILNTV